MARAQYSPEEIQAAQHYYAQGNLPENAPFTKTWLWGKLPIDHPAIPKIVKVQRQTAYQNAQGESTSPLPRDEKSVQWAVNLYNILDQYGVESVEQLPVEIQQQLPYQGRYKQNNQSFGTQLRDFVTSGPFLTAAGGLGAMYFAPATAAGAGSGAGATGTGAAATYGAAGEFAGAGAGSIGTAGVGSTTGLAGGAAGGTGLTMGAGTTAAPMGAGATGSGITAGAGGVTGIGAGTGAATAGAGAGLGGLVQTAGKAMPWANLAGTVLEYMGSREAGKTAEDLMRQQMESDQWRGQQPRYFEPMYEAATKGIGGTPYGEAITDATSRKMASMGYNMSGNQMGEIAKSLNLGTTDYMRALTPLATGRGESQAPGQFAPALMEAAQAPYGIAGYGLDQIIKNWPSGSGSATTPSSSLGSGGSFQNYQPTDYQNIFL
jgi:hypothetical protein